MLRETDRAGQIEESSGMGGGWRVWWLDGVRGVGGGYGDWMGVGGWEEGMMVGWG